MKQKKQLTHWLAVIVIGVVLGLGLQFVRAWTEPTVAPPNGNVGAPINTSANPQIKNGKLNVQDVCLLDNSKCLSTVSGTPVTPGTPGTPGAPAPAPAPEPSNPCASCGTCGDSFDPCSSNGGPCNWVSYQTASTCTTSGWSFSTVGCCMM